MKDLIHKIETAFDGVEYPGDDDLTDSTYGEEPEALKVEFLGKYDWRTLESSFLDQAPEGWGTALSFFSANALHFYLPSYLIADVRGDLQNNDPSIRLCMFLTPQAENQKLSKMWGGGTMGEHTRRDFESFNAAQVSAVIAYLWWKLESEVYNPTIEQALENYWLERETSHKRDSENAI